MNKADRDDWIMFIAFLLTGLIGASSFLFYRALVPIFPPWDFVVFEYPLLTFSEIVVLIAPGLIMGVAFVVSASEYLDSLDTASNP